MKPLDVIEVPCNGHIRRIELHQGDLTNLSPDDAIDILIISAFRGDYLRVPGTLIHALSMKGISVEDLAQHKAVDLREAFSCWLSHQVSAADPGIQFDRILCFEPSVLIDPPSVVGDIFRALAPFLGGTPPIRTAAMPIVATGNQGYTVTTMLPPIIEAAVHWMSIGFPLETLKIFAYDEASAGEARKIFARLRAQHAAPSMEKSSCEYDVFISYSRPDADAANIIHACLKKQYLRIFIDIQSLEKGAVWQPHIFRVLDSCERMIAVYSPAYVQSKVCQEEFNIAWARGRKHDRNVIYPIYWQSAELPTYMEMLNYVDCRETRNERLSQACVSLLKELKA